MKTMSASSATILRDGVWGDWQYIESLRRKESAALGFIPKATYESTLKKERIGNRERYKYQTLRVTEDNGDLTGFCLTSFAQKDLAHVFQVVIQPDARRWERALLLINDVEREAKQRGRLGVTCRVAYDLESNAFWKAIGYVPFRQVTSTWMNQKESKSKRPLWVYEKWFDETTQAGLVSATEISGIVLL